MTPRELLSKSPVFKNFRESRLSPWATKLNQRRQSLTGDNLKSLGQLELPIERKRERDRNADLGGRSFYFFDFDDNVAFLSTSIYVFHKESGREVELSSGEFAQFNRTIGKSGVYRDYKIDLNEETGTFRNFRDKDLSLVEKMLGRQQPFLQDVAAALGHPDFQWKGPSWNCFHHATLNQRPVAVITARGHHPETIRDGIHMFVKGGFIPQDPNYLCILPVSNKDVRLELGDAEFVQSTAQLKRSAIRKAVEMAIEKYGPSAHHRFGMSDDDPHNIELITSEMQELKTRFPEMSFFIIETHNGQATKWEVYPDRSEATMCSRLSPAENIGIFEQLSMPV